MSLKFEGLVYCGAVRSVPAYGCKTWNLPAEHICRLKVFDHRHRSLAVVECSDRGSKAVRNLVIDAGNGSIILQRMKHGRIR